MLDVVEELKKYNIFDVSIFKPTYKKEISIYLANNSSRFELVIVFGGDGTLNEALNGLMNKTHRPKLLYVPTGTVNDFGHYLKIPKDFKETFKLLLNEASFIDLCRVNEMYFLYVLACGKFSGISYGANINNSKKSLGIVYYYLRAFKEFLKHKSKSFIINDLECSLFLGLNVWRIAGFNLGNKKGNKLNDGMIDVVFFKDTTFLNTIAIGLFLLFGIRLKGVVRKERVSSLNIKCDSKKQFNTDGEESYFTDKVSVVVIKEALEIFIPKESMKKYL